MQVQTAGRGFRRLDVCPLGLTVCGVLCFEFCVFSIGYDAGIPERPHLFERVLQIGLGIVRRHDTRFGPRHSLRGGLYSASLPPCAIFGGPLFGRFNGLLCGAQAGLILER